MSFQSGSSSDDDEDVFRFDKDADDGLKELLDEGGFGAEEEEEEKEHFGNCPCRIRNHPGYPRYYAPYHFQTRLLMNCDPMCSCRMGPRRQHPRESWYGPKESRCFRGGKMKRMRYREEEMRECGEEDEEHVSRGLSLSLLDRGPTGVGAGLSNLGNTCFINSILQCLTHTAPFVKALRSWNHAMPCGSEEFCVLCTLREHIELSFASSGKVISPVKFFENLDYISSCFRQYQQEDAHEFLQCFLDRLERCSLDSNSAKKSPLLQDNNLVEQIFGGRLVSKLLCCNCGHCSEKFEPLIDMSLEIEDVDTLESALESFTKVEKIEDAEVKITCENCKEEASMEKQLVLDQAPLVAALHLKRFKADGYCVQKIGKHVKFPLELKLNPYANDSQDGNQVDLKYQLYAFVVHDGFSPTSGHYFCYIRSSPDTWHKLDDSMVIKVKEEVVLSQAAYILFYVRDGTPWFSNLVESQKLPVEPSVLNSSPKSVLDNVDGEDTLSPGGADNSKASNGGDADDESTSMDFLNETQLEGFQTTETQSDAERKSTQISDASEQNGPNLCCDESKVDMPLIDAFAPLKESDFPEGVQDTQLCASPSAKEKNLNQGTADIERANNVYLSPPPTGELPGTGYKMVRDHLKVENRVTSKGLRNKSNMNPEKRVALKYMNKNMPSCRRLKLMAAMVPRNDKRRSPCKKASFPGTRRKLESRVEFSR